MWARAPTLQRAAATAPSQPATPGAALFARVCDGSMWLLPQSLWHRLKSSSTANVELSALEQQRHALPLATETAGALQPATAPKTAKNALQPISLLELTEVALT